MDNSKQTKQQKIEALLAEDEKLKVDIEITEKLYSKVPSDKNSVARNLCIDKIQTIEERRKEIKKEINNLKK